LLLASCSDEDFVSSQFIVGQWELASSTSGKTGQVTAHLPGNGTRLVFSKTTFEMYSNGNLVNSGKYKIYYEVNPMIQEKGNRIIYNGNRDAPRTFFVVNGNELDISHAVHDGGGSTYRRIAN
jgi:hypothetical protein